MTKSDVSARKEASQKRSKETVKAIIQAATHILYTKGSHEFTTNHIAKTAGVSIGSLYQYFPNKNAISSMILDTFVEEQGKRVLGRLLETTDESELEDVIDWVVRELYRYRTQEIVVARAVAHEISKGEFHKKMVEIKSELSTNILLFLHGLVGVHINTKNQIKVELIVEGVDNMIFQLSERGPDSTDQEVGLLFIMKMISTGLEDLEK
ncbi:MAG: TetR/AcrR family transcriptional regulator [Bacteriovoracaceae bacterium]|nr:TetR/AcrR family transcriptional regulator [Bacteriovoracaceae bacterium]